MNIRDFINKSQHRKIQDKFGLDFLGRLNKNLDNVIAKWQITNLVLIESYSANLVLKVDSGLYGKCIVKVSRNNENLSSESDALESFSEKKICQLYDVNFESLMLIEECIEPGTVLREDDSLDNRLRVFINLYKGLHTEVKKLDEYPTYETWINEITYYMSKQNEFVELYESMRKAEALYKALSKRYNRLCLLHGDFHHDNILKDGNENYRLIDPKGVLGDPIFDLPRFILNEFWFETKTKDLEMKLIKIIDKLSKSLKLPKRVIEECIYIETMMGTCWWIEDGPTTDEYNNLVETVEFVERVLKLN